VGKGAGETSCECVGGERNFSPLTLSPASKTTQRRSPKQKKLGANRGQKGAVQEGNSKRLPPNPQKKGVGVNRHCSREKKKTQRARQCRRRKKTFSSSEYHTKGGEVTPKMSNKLKRHGRNKGTCRAHRMAALRVLCRYPKTTKKKNWPWFEKERQKMEKDKGHRNRAGNSKRGRDVFNTL